MTTMPLLANLAPSTTSRTSAPDRRTERDAARPEASNARDNARTQARRAAARETDTERTSGTESTSDATGTSSAPTAADAFSATLDAAIAGLPQATPITADGGADAAPTTGSAESLPVAAGIPPALPGSLSPMPALPGITELAAPGAAPVEGQAQSALSGEMGAPNISDSPRLAPLRSARLRNSIDAPISPETARGSQITSASHLAPATPTATNAANGTGSDAGTGAGTSDSSGEFRRQAERSGARRGLSELDGSLVPVTGPAPTSTTTPTKAPVSVEVARQTFPEITALAQRATPGTHRLAITLHPEDLGEVKVTMIVRAGSLQVHLSADTPAARAALASGTNDLHKMLELSLAPDTKIVVRESSSTSTQLNNPDSRGTQPGFSFNQSGQSGQSGRQAQSGHRPTPQDAARTADEDLRSAAQTRVAPRAGSAGAGRLDQMV